MTVAEIREHLAKTGHFPSPDGQKTIFQNNIRSGGNYDRDFQLYAALR